MMSDFWLKHLCLLLIHVPSMAEGAEKSAKFTPQRYKNILRLQIMKGHCILKIMETHEAIT